MAADEETLLNMEVTSHTDVLRLQTLSKWNMILLMMIIGNWRLSFSNVYFRESKHKTKEPLAIKINKKQNEQIPMQTWYFSGHYTQLPLNFRVHSLFNNTTHHNCKLHRLPILLKTDRNKQTKERTSNPSLPVFCFTVVPTPFHDTFLTSPPIDSSTLQFKVQTDQTM